MTLAGRSAVITGASQGLGAEIARHFVAAGASVMLCARDAERLAAVAADLAAQAQPGQLVLARPADIADAAAVDALFEAAFAAFPRLDILVANAGVHGAIGRAEEVDWEGWTRAIEVNLFGTLRCCRAVLPSMRRAGYGKIMALSGGGATAPLPRMSAYAASKAALVRLMETLAKEVEGDGIDVNTIAPGAMATRLIEEVVAAGPDRVGAAYHARMREVQAKGGTPPALAAELCVFLASAASDGITGKLISAQWDRWADWPGYRVELGGSDVYTLRRITGRDRGMPWGDA